MNPERTLNRIIAFTDAVVAIAITLIVLPLVEVANRSTQSTRTFLAENAPALAAAALSFLVIGTLWRAHHRMWNGFTGVSPAMLTLNFVWLASVIFLPLPTVLIEASSSDSLSAQLYVGTIVVSSLSLAFQSVLAERVGLVSTETLTAAAYLPRWYRWTIVLCMVVVFGLTITVPALGLWSLLLLEVGVLAQAAARRWGSSEPPTVSPAESASVG